MLIQVMKDTLIFSEKTQGNLSQLSLCIQGELEGGRNCLGTKLKISVDHSKINQ